MISFVIPAHNEEQLLPRTIAALREAASATGVTCEIIVVNDASTDRTPDLARAAGARVVTVAHRQISRVRNAGARAAAGELIVFVDADTVVPPKTLAATLAAVARGAAGGGAVLRFDRPVPFLIRLVEASLHLAMRSMRLAAGAYLFCSRRAFEATGGFDEALYVTEELVFSRALRRVGPVVVLRDHVVTSGRKARTHSLRELAAPVTHLVTRGTRTLRDRGRLDLWYGDRRRDPAGP